MSSMGDGGSVPKRRKQDVQKVVVSVKAQDHKTEQGPPADRWSWRKYGQKPIKGSPHPRGYYKCSSYKGCSARKQVEKCRNDASLLIITYTSSHSHEDYATYPVQEQTHNSDKSDAGAALNNDMPLAEATAAASKLYGEEETCDFYDELEELLPVSASPLPSLACMVQEQLL